MVTTNRAGGSATLCHLSSKHARKDMLSKCKGAKTHATSGDWQGAGLRANREGRLDVTVRSCKACRRRASPR
eukprot:14734268-Alexandrium_andersonii.AAC.1